MHQNRRIARSLFVLLMALLFSSPFFFGASHAHAAPLTTSVCAVGTGGCAAETAWTMPGFTVHGVETGVVTSSPNYAGTGSYLQKFIEVRNTYTHIQIGMTSNAYPCDSHVDFYYMTTTSAGTTIKCFLMNTNDYNNRVLLKLSYFVSNGGGWFITISTDHNVYCNNPAPCTYTSIADSHASTSLDSLDYQQILGNDSFSGDAIWGTDWDTNEYFDGSTWTFDGQYAGRLDGKSANTLLTNSNGTYQSYNMGYGAIEPQIPPQMYWDSPPSGSSNSGGSLYTCDYSTNANSCILGG